MVEMKKKIALLGILVTFMFTITGCASWDRFVTDVKSDVSGGMQRTIKVYTANGDLIAEYNGKIDMDILRIERTQNRSFFCWQPHSPPFHEVIITYKKEKNLVIGSFFYKL